MTNLQCRSCRRFLKVTGTENGAFLAEPCGKRAGKDLSDYTGCMDHGGKNCFTVTAGGCADIFAAQRYGRILTEAFGADSFAVSCSGAEFSWDSIPSDRVLGDLCRFAYCAFGGTAPSEVGGRLSYFLSDGAAGALSPDACAEAVASGNCFAELAEMLKREKECGDAIRSAAASLLLSAAEKARGEAEYGA